MGATNYDKGAGHRNVWALYHVTDPDGLRMLLEDYYKLRERRYKGDYAICDVLLDLQLAIREAGLTDRQRLALYLTFHKQLTPDEGAEEMKITRYGFDKHVNGGLKRIAAVFQRWDYGAVEGEGSS